MLLVFSLLENHNFESERLSENMRKSAAGAKIFGQNCMILWQILTNFELSYFFSRKIFKNPIKSDKFLQKTVCNIFLNKIILTFPWNITNSYNFRLSYFFRGKYYTGVENNHRRDSGFFHLVCPFFNLKRYHGEWRAEGMPQFLTVAVFSLTMLFSTIAKHLSRRNLGHFSFSRLWVKWREGKRNIS